MDNRITDEQRNQILKKLDERINNYSCVLCGQNQWNLEPFVVPLSVSSGFSIKIGGQMLPLTAMTCSNCGNTHFFNLVTLGLKGIFNKEREDK